LLCQQIAHGEGGTDAIEKLQRIYVLLTKAEAPPAGELIAHCQSRYPRPHQQVRQPLEAERRQRHAEHLARMPEPRPSEVTEGFAGSRNAVPTSTGNVIRWPRRADGDGWMKR
jgi:hypothetical protein